MPGYQFTPFPELRTERLLLRQIKKEDVQEIFFLRSSEDVLRFIGREPAVAIEEAAAFIERITKALEANESILWGIALQSDPATLIGTICYWNMQPENYRTEIGYALHPQYWRQGIMKEAIGKVLEYGFETLQLHSVEARISAGNRASAAILESTGFVQEGYLKEEMFFRGQFVDSIIYTRFNN